MACQPNRLGTMVARPADTLGAVKFISTNPGFRNVRLLHQDLGDLVNRVFGQILVDLRDQPRGNGLAIMFAKFS